MISACDWGLIGQRAVEIAESEAAAGAREVGGNNRGPWVQKYMRGDEGPWCAAFYCWCWGEAAREVGVDLPVKYTRGVSALWVRMLLFGKAIRPSAARELGFTPQPGDACFWSWHQDGHLDHVSMVHRVDGDVLYTIGGNEGDEESGAPVRIKRKGRIGELPALYGIGRMLKLTLEGVSNRNAM